jgi:uncharacterized Fe-S cluster-containing radical SAM superfamily protein
MGTAAADPATRRAYGQVHRIDGQIALTDLTTTSFSDVQSRYFRLFTPVKRERLRLPTSLREFHALRHFATLSDSPVLAAYKLGGHWTDHNLAAIFHLAACNLRCRYCYVDYRHLSGKDSFPSNAKAIITEFIALKTLLASRATPLSTLRISGGEPTLAPELIVSILEEFVSRGLDRDCLLKVESNMTTFAYALERSGPSIQNALRNLGRYLAIHVTVHSVPGTGTWRRAMDGLQLALSLSLDVYPAIGGADWSADDMNVAYDALATLAPNLPLRLAVRPFNLTYNILRNRHGLGKYQLDTRVAPSQTWEEVLRHHTGLDYLHPARHEVSIVADG